MTVGRPPKTDAAVPKKRGRPPKVTPAAPVELDASLPLQQAAFDFSAVEPVVATPKTKSLKATKVRAVKAAAAIAPKLEAPVKPRARKKHAPAQVVSAPSEPAPVATETVSKATPPVKLQAARSRVKLVLGDAFIKLHALADESVDLIIADPPYGLGKDYGNDSDFRRGDDYIEWSIDWLTLALPKLKPTGTMYLFATWQHAPELFSWVKRQMTMINEIIWDRRVPSMGGSTRRYSSVHDNVGVFVNGSDYYFDLDSVRIPYDAATKKARSRKIFEGKKWLELGYNPKDLWSFSRIHGQDPERTPHPTQKPVALIERMVLASCPPTGLVLDPFMGSGTSAVASCLHNRRFVGYELNPVYYEMARERVEGFQAVESVESENE